VNQSRTNSRDTLSLHREMYERRLRRIEERSGLTEREVSETANDPSLFRRAPKTARRPGDAPVSKD
jgi:hypothetical protein